MRARPACAPAPGSSNGSPPPRLPAWAAACAMVTARRRRRWTAAIMTAAPMAADGRGYEGRAMTGAARCAATSKSAATAAAATWARRYVAAGGRLGRRLAGRLCDGRPPMMPPPPPCPRPPAARRPRLWLRLWLMAAAGAVLVTETTVTEAPVVERRVYYTTHRVRVAPRHQSAAPAAASWSKPPPEPANAAEHSAPDYASG